MPRSHHFLVSGIVQGVGFRWFVERTARAAGLRGWVRNLHDGRVEVLVQGPEAALAAFEHALREGPRGSEVRNVVGSSVDVVAEKKFEIRSTAGDPAI